VRQLPGWFESVKARLSHTDYQHTEFDEGVAGTVFSNQGYDLRIETRHRPLGGWQGVVGVQTESSRFSAVGDEAFAPFSRTRSQAVFVHEELPTHWGQVTAGARWESVRVESLGNPDLPRFDEAIGAQKFSPFSVAAGAVFKLSPTWSLTGNAALTQRAPKDYELFANGPHLATNAWEIGQKDLGLEKSKSLDAGVQWKSGHDSLNVTAFASQFANYIGLMNTNQYRDEEGEPVGSDAAGEPGVLPLQIYQGVKAQFRGLEASGRKRLWQGTSTLDLDWRADMVRATQSSTGEPLPRIAPMRVGATLVHAQGPFSAKLGADWHSAQKRVPEGSVATQAYTLVNASLSYRQKLDTTVLNWFARLDNLTDQLAYSASSILTSTAFGKSPLPGRSFKLGVQASF
jgi:iron complex outermembrane receptor protein